VTFSCLIAEDEPLARRRLETLVREVSWLRCVGVAEDGPAVREALDTHRPDLLFLDVEMPGFFGLAALEAAHYRPVVVFTTAYDRYAVRAFDLAATDYLLKPFGRPRFQAAVERAREALHCRATAEKGVHRGSGDQTPLARLLVRDRGRLLALSTEAIDHLEAEDDYVRVHCADRRFLVRMPLALLERRLDPRRFVRVHRRRIVNLERVTAALPGPSGLVLELRDGTRLAVSRRRRAVVRARFS
jgi:two-component system, LytTR family, response regulator